MWTSKLWKKIRSGNLLVKVDNKNKHTENLIKMKTSHNLKCKIGSPKKLNTSKRVIRNRQLSSATPEEIKTTFEKQGVMG